MEYNCHRYCMLILVLKKLIDSFLSGFNIFSAAIQAALEKLSVLPNNLALKNFCSNQYSKSMVSFRETGWILNRL